MEVPDRHDSTSVVDLYEELRRWALQPAHQPPASRTLGQALLQRKGLGEWMTAVVDLQPACSQPRAGGGDSHAALPSSTRAQLAAALADVVLIRLREASP
jgi:hypothetical protein